MLKEYSNENQQKGKKMSSEFKTDSNTRFVHIQKIYLDDYKKRTGTETK